MMTVDARGRLLSLRARTPNRSPRRSILRATRQRGVAILSVLLIVAIASALTYSLASQQSMVIAQSQNVLVGDQIRNLLLGGEVLARQSLFQDWDDEETRESDTLLETWAQALPPFEIPGGFIEVNMRDLHSCFNLNSLPVSPRDPERTATMKTFFLGAGLEGVFVDRWLDWIDPDDQVVDAGAEDGDYLSADRAYRTPNSRAAHVSELLLLGEVEFEPYNRLREAACILPEGAEDKININTVNQATLQALFPTVSATEVASLVESERNYTEIGEFQSDYSGFEGADVFLGFTSEFFEVSVRAELGGSSAEMVSMLYRNPSNGEISVLNRDFSRRFVSRFTVEVEEEAN